MQPTESFICTDLGLTLKLSALETLYCGRFISSTQLIKLNDLFIPPTDACATPHFPKKLTLGMLILLYNLSLPPTL